MPVLLNACVNSVFFSILLGSGNPLQENFHPARFLLEKHLDTT